MIRYHHWESTCHGQSLYLFRQLNDFGVGWRVGRHCLLQAAEVLDLPAQANNLRLGARNLILQQSILTLQLTGSRFESVPAKARAAASPATGVGRRSGLRVDVVAVVQRLATSITSTVVLLQLQLPRTQALLHMLKIRWQSEGGVRVTGGPACSSSSRESETTT